MSIVDVASIFDAKPGRHGFEDSMAFSIEYFAHDQEVKTDARGPAAYRHRPYQSGKFVPTV